MTAQQVSQTEFAPAGRLPLPEVREQFRCFVGTQGRAFYDALPSLIVVLNSQRQVVFANEAALFFLGHKDVEQVLGVRPGEALGCINAAAHDGCGTSRHCRDCGAVLSILSAIDGATAGAECNLLRRVTTDIEGLDLKVHAAPIAIEGQRFILFTVDDNTNQTRRRNMERIFFHDMLNLAGGIDGMTGMLCEEVPDSLKKDVGVLHIATGNLVEEIMAQRDMSSAEHNELRPVAVRIDSLEILKRVQGFYAHSPVAHGRSIIVDQDSASVDLTVDPRLVQRVLGNMLKNALEEVLPGGQALLSCREDGADLVFSVHNQGFIPETVQDSIFHRSFSTKGMGRGLGTYSMLLLTERYLHGSVGFTSTPAEGTEFYLRIPRQVPDGQSGAV